MFLRKLVVMVVPVLLAALVCAVLPLMDALGFWAWVAKGLTLGIALALLLPLSGASKRKEPFASLLWLPMIALAAVVIYQYLAWSGVAQLPVLRMLETQDAQVLMTESAFIGFMAVQAVRTKR